MRIIEKEKFNVVGSIITCEEQKLTIEMPKLFKKVEERKLEIVNRINDLIMDICISINGKMFKQMACYEVSSLENIPIELTVLTIPKYNYLYYKHVGLNYEIYDAFVAMYDYALENKLVLDETEFKIEIYNDELSEYDLYLKLK
ncbi:MAG: transcriptional regulator [Haloplasmataceae bacterium]|nr:transcriptional regulator [Haloplasmataceae bacterium]